MLKQRFVLDFGTKLLHYLIAAIGGILVARFAGPTILGTVAYGVAYAGVFSFINGLFGPSHIKLISEGVDQGKCNATFFYLKLITSGIFLLCVLIFYVFQKYVFKIDFESRDHELVILIAVGITIVQQIISTINTTFIARMEQAKSNLPFVIQSILYNSLRVILALLGFGAVILISSQLISLILMLPFYWYLIRNYPFTHFDKQIAKKYLVISFPVLIIVLANSLNLNLGRIVLEKFTNTTNLGYYAAGYNVASILLLMASSAGTVFFPMFSRSIVNNEFDNIYRQVERYEKFLLMWIFPFVLFLSAFGQSFILLLLGQKYLVAIPVFRILIISSFLQLLAIPYGNILSGSGLFKLSAVLSVIRLVLFLVFLIILVHPKLLNLSGTGLAIAQLIADVFMFISFYLVSKKNIGILTLNKTFKYYIVGLIFYFIFYEMGKYMNFSIFSEYLIAIIFFSLFYLFYFLFGLIKWYDIKDLIDLLNLRKMIDYITSEFKPE